MLLRLLIFLTICVLIFLPFNWITYRQLVRIHPRRRRLVLGLVIAGNLMWPLLPFLRVSNAVMRFLRATLGPVWIAWTMFAMLYALAMFLVLLAWIPFRRRGTFAEFARWPSRVFVAGMVLLSIIGAYDALVPLRVERVPIAIEGLPASLEGTRIALLGDLHVGLFTRPSRLDRIFSTTDALRPDVVLLAGDLIDDDPYFVPKLLAGTRALSTSTPLLAVLGNHEMYGDPNAVIAQLHGSRIRLLVNEGYAHRELWIAGLSDYAARDIPDQRALAPDFDKALAGKPPASPVIALAHQPRVIDEAKRRRVPLALCAHTHGGQMGIRPLGWSLAGVFLRYHMGLYRAGPTQLYINTGTGYWLLPWRPGMTPEITLLELHAVARSRGHAVTQSRGEKPGDAPERRNGMKRLTVILALVLAMSVSAQQRRNPFQYVEPPPAPVKEQRVIAAVVIAAPKPPQVVTVPPARVEPAPPVFPYHFIGRFGHDEDPIAALVSDDRVIIAQAGDTIDGKFIVRSVGLNTVEIGFVSHPSTIRLQLDGWL